jgi:hypothetical protein
MLPHGMHYIDKRETIKTRVMVFVQKLEDNKTNFSQKNTRSESPFLFPNEALLAVCPSLFLEEKKYIKLINYGNSYI